MQRLRRVLAEPDFRVITIGEPVKIENLVAAVGAGHINNQPQLPRSVVDILTLELFQLSLHNFLYHARTIVCGNRVCNMLIQNKDYLISPRESFVGINGAIKSPRERNHPPANLIKSTLTYKL